MTETRHDAIADDLTAQILRGRYRPGDRLPSERDLASQHGANRGAIREAIKKLEQMGLADVQPGGARVLPVEEASLDVIGPLLALDDVPDPYLVEQVLSVMSALMQVAVRQAMVRATDAQIDHARVLIARLREPDLTHSARVQARLELGRQFMKMSGNLVLTLIARALRVQVFDGASRAATFIHAGDDPAEFLDRMDTALSSRDSDALLATMQVFVDRSHKQVLSALHAAHAASNGHRKIAS